jgi:hypothetical protein
VGRPADDNVGRVSGGLTPFPTALPGSGSWSPPSVRSAVFDDEGIARSGGKEVQLRRVRFFSVEGRESGNRKGVQCACRRKLHANERASLDPSLITRSTLYVNGPLLEPRLASLAAASGPAPHERAVARRRHAQLRRPNSAKRMRRTTMPCGIRSAVADPVRDDLRTGVALESRQRPIHGRKTRGPRESPSNDPEHD